MVVLPLLGLMFIGLVMYVTGLTAPGLLAMTGGAVAIVAVCIVSGAVNQVFTLAVFQHATGGAYLTASPPPTSSARVTARRCAGCAG